MAGISGGALVAYTNRKKGIKSLQKGIAEKMEKDAIFRNYYKNAKTGVYV